MHDCPTDADLTALLNPSRRRTATANRTAIHLANCRSCRTRLDQLGKLFNPPSSSLNNSNTANLKTAVLPVLSETPNLAKTQVFGEASVSEVFLESAIINQAPHLPQVPGFEMLTEIGRGGMGIVYLARHRQLNRRTALKMVLTGTMADPTAAQRFVFEAEVLARVQHPQIVQVYEANTYLNPNGVRTPYLAMEYLDGGSLAAYAGRYGPLPIREAVELIEGLARAIHTAHLQGVIHRDLKPGNILRNKEGTFKVSDFGLAKMNSNRAEITATGLVVGTPAYMAPEQAAGEKCLGPSIDIYALGAMLFELLTGRTPFVGEEPMSIVMQLLRDEAPEVRKFRHDIPRDLSAIVMRAVAKKPEQRYQSAEGFADDLQRYLEGRVVLARPVGSGTRTIRWCKRNPIPTITAFSFFVVATTWLVLLNWQWQRAEEMATREKNARLTIEAQAQETAKALLQEQQALKLSLQHQANLDFDQAVNWCESGDVARGVRQFLSALELAIRLEDTELERAIRLNLAGWSRTVMPRQKLATPITARACTYSSDGRWLFTSNHESQVQLREAHSGKVVTFFGDNLLKSFSPSSRRRAFYNLCLAPDETLLAAGSSDGRLWIWEVPQLTDDAKPASVEVQHQFKVANCEDIWQVLFAAQDRLWAACSDGVIRCYQLQRTSPKLVKELFLHPRADVQCLALAPDGFLWSGDRTGKITRWNTVTGESQVMGQHAGWALKLAVSPDGKKLASVGSDGQFRLWSLPSNQPIPIQGKALDLSLDQVCFSPDSERLIFSSNDGMVRVWHLRSQSFSSMPLFLPGQVTSLQMVPNQNLLAACGGSQLLQFQLPTVLGESLPLPMTRKTSSIFTDFRQLQYQQTPDGPQLNYLWHNTPTTTRLNESNTPPRFLGEAGHSLGVVPGDEGEKWVLGSTHLLHYDRDGNKLQELPWPPLLTPRTIHYIHGQRAILLVGKSFVARWDMADTKKLDLLVNLNPSLLIGVSAVRSNSDEFLYTLGSQVTFWNWKTNQPARPKLELTDLVSCAQYSPDGTKIAFGLRNYLAEIWSLDSGLLTKPLRHQSSVTSMAWFPDGQRLVTGCGDGTARIWNTVSGRPLTPQMRHPYEVTSVEIDPDGSKIFTAARSRQRSDTQLLCWPGLPEPMTGTVAELRKHFNESLFLNSQE